MEEHLKRGVIGVTALQVLKGEVKEYAKLKIISEMALVREHIKLLQDKYSCTFAELEEKIKNGPEDFEQWDDYIELKAYLRSLADLRRRIGEVERAEDVKVTE